MRPHNWREHPRHFGPPWERHRRFIFWRFAFIFGGISILFLAAIGIVIYLVLTMLPSERPRISMLIPICGVPLAFMLISFLAGGLAFRRLGTPFGRYCAGRPERAPVRERPRRAGQPGAPFQQHGG